MKQFFSSFKLFKYSKTTNSIVAHDQSSNTRIPNVFQRQFVQYQNETRQYPVYVMDHFPTNIKT